MHVHLWCIEYYICLLLLEVVQNWCYFIRRWITTFTHSELSISVPLNHCVAFDLLLCPKYSLAVSPNGCVERRRSRRHDWQCGLLGCLCADWLGRQEKVYSIFFFFFNCVTPVYPVAIKLSGMWLSLTSLAWCQLQLKFTNELEVVTGQEWGGCWSSQSCSNWVEDVKIGALCFSSRLLQWLWFHRMLPDLLESNVVNVRFVVFFASTSFSSVVVFVSRSQAGQSGCFPAWGCPVPISVDQQTVSLMENGCESVVTS